MNSCCIKEKGKDNYFRGWDRFGEMVMKPGEKYAYRMSRTLSARTMEKLEAEKGISCEILKVS